MDVTFLAPPRPAVPGRRRFGLWALLMLLVACLCPWGLVQAAGPYKVVMVLPRAEGAIEKAFKDYFAKRGIGLQTTVLQYSGRPEDQAALVHDIRRVRPDLIYTWGTPSTLAVAGPAQAEGNEPKGKYVRDIPIVFTSVTDPVAAGLVTNLEKPGRNLTGASHLAPLPVQLNTIAAYRPFSRLGFLYNPKEANALLILAALKAQEEKQHFTLLAEAVPAGADGEPDAAAIPRLVAGLKAAGAEFLYLGPDTFIAFTHRERVTQAALDAGLPTFSAIESAVRNAKALFGLFSPQANVGRFAAFKALNILEQGTPVAEVPIETLQHFSLLINMEVARSLGVYPPLMLLNVADVIADNRVTQASVPAGPPPTR